MFEILVSILIFFIGASLLLYVVLGGADYGAGILEMLPAGSKRKKQQHLINEAMGPVWEANHMWLIIIVVILFMGFPKIFNTLMVALHLPMVALLLGIVVRGSVFTFRHYDALPDHLSQKLYTILFAASSLWTSLWLGIIAASLYRGKINPQSLEFVEAYVEPWWGLFPVTMGIFVVCIFAFLASIYLIGETEDLEMKKFFRKRALVFNILVVIFGGLVFAAAEMEGIPLLGEFLSNPVSLGCLLLATLFFAVLWKGIPQSRYAWGRVVAAGQGTLILFGWYALHAPQALLLRQGPISFFEAAAPEATLKQLVLALLIGSLFIFPSLFYLLRVFKSKSQNEKSGG